jgi:hypothetical protein
MSNDIRSILDRLATVEGRLSPAQQKVPQLPALFKPRGIRALGSKTDPAHPMDGYMVGDSVEPRRTALEEAMAEIEEDMLSKVKKSLTQYLDRLEKKVAVSRDLKDKAVDAVEKGKAEEDLDEFAPVGGDDREPDEEEILRQLAAQWWNGTEKQMAKAQNTLAAMGWEIGPDESGDDDAGVYVYRIGDQSGRDTIPFAHSELDLLDELDYSAASGATAQPSVNQQAQTAGNAIKKYMPGATKFAANTVRQMKGQDPTKDPSYAKLSPAQQQQYVQAQKTIDATDADELEKFDSNQAAANIQGMAKSVVNPANMPDVTLKPIQYADGVAPSDRKTAADYPPATVGPMEEDELKAIRRLAFGKEELDELDFSGSTPPQAQANKLDAAGNQISQAKQDIEAGNNVKGAFNAARGINQALDAGGATLGDKASLAWTGLKAAGSAGLAYMQGKNPQAAAADSVAKSIVSPLSGVDVKQAAATAQQYRGPNAQDITKDPQFAKLPLAKQQQVTQAQQQVRDMSDDNFANVQNFDAKQTQANLASAMKEETTPAATFEMADGKSLDCYGDDNKGYELRHGKQALPSRFKNLDDAGMAVRLYQARKQQQQRPEQDLSQDYIEER